MAKIRRNAPQAIAWDAPTMVIFSVPQEVRLKAHYIALKANTSFAEVARNAMAHAIENWEKLHGVISTEVLQQNPPQASKRVPRLKREIFPETVVTKNAPKRKQAQLPEEDHKS